MRGNVRSFFIDKDYHRLERVFCLPCQILVWHRSGYYTTFYGHFSQTPPTMSTFTLALGFFLLSSVMLLLAFFKPSLALPGKHSRAVALCVWALCLGVSAMHVRNLRPADHNLSLEERRSKDWSLLEAPLPPLVAGQLTPLSPTQARTRLAALLYELESLRSNRQFHERRFEADSVQAVAWKHQVDLLRGQLALSPQAQETFMPYTRQLLELALCWAYDAGKESPRSARILQSIRDAIQP